jgi:primosomal replication protein N
LNEFSISARIVEKECVRYTPAGIPVVQLLLEHTGEVLEAGLVRQVDFQLSAKGLGDTALALNELRLNAGAQFSGFLARKSKTAKSLVFHITAFASVHDDVKPGFDNDIEKLEQSNGIWT